MKLHKTREGDTKTREVEAGPHVDRTSDGVHLSWTARGHWCLLMTEAEARDLAAALLGAVR